MLDRELVRAYYYTILEITKCFPAMDRLRKWDRHPETISIWYNMLLHDGCNDWELTNVMGRLLYHLFNCDCGTVPTPEEKYDQGLQAIGEAPERLKKTIADSIAQDVKNGRHDEWLREFAGTKYIEGLAHMHHHLIALRRGMPTTYCPFKE